MERKPSGSQRPLLRGDLLHRPARILAHLGIGIVDNGLEKFSGRRDLRFRRAPPRPPCADWLGDGRGRRRSQRPPAPPSSCRDFEPPSAEPARIVVQRRYQRVDRMHPVDIGPERLGGNLANHPVGVVSARVINSAAGFRCENASALTAARRTCASPSVVTEVKAGIDSSSLRNPITPIACTRTAASTSRKASSAGLSVSLRRSSFSARRLAVRTKAWACPTKGRIASAQAGPSIRPCCWPQRPPPPVRDRPRA